MRSLCCQFVYVSPYQLLNGWNSLQGILYVYHGSWAHLKAVFLKSLPVKVKVTLRLKASQSVSLGVEPQLGLMTRYLLLFDSYGLVLWGTLSDERTGVSFVYAAGPRQRSLSRVRVLFDSWPHFTVSDMRLIFSSPTTHRVTVEVFDTASTRVSEISPISLRVYICIPLLLKGNGSVKTLPWPRIYPQQ
jgi:hypothetical protein